MEIFAGDDVRRRLRPALRHFHVFLAEDRHALFVSDQGSALFPFHCVERRLLPVGEVPLEGQTCPSVPRCLFYSRIRNREFPAQCLLHGCHPFLPRLRAPSRRGTLLFYSSAPGRGAAHHFRVWAKANATRFKRLVKAASEKKPIALRSRFTVTK